MWTRTYFVLLLVRLYFALSPSYIHPDEHFQGPEVIAGEIFQYQHYRSWEFTTNAPIRSIFPLWPVYALPMLVVKAIWAGIGPSQSKTPNHQLGTQYESLPPPDVIYFCSRLVFFILSFVLEDWAVYELVQSPHHRRLAVTLVASSYVTWTYQTHTFSNSIETLAVLWTLVMIQRIRESKVFFSCLSQWPPELEMIYPDQRRQRTSIPSSVMLGLLLTYGCFNRITFPAFTFFPCLFLLPHFWSHPLSAIIVALTAAGTAGVAIAADTEFYDPLASFITLFKAPIITPLNSLMYNSHAANLADHGLHPRYQHIAVSLPLLLGPALLLVRNISLSNTNMPIISAAVLGTAILSIMPHQEPRFLLPVVPLILISVHLPHSRTRTRSWLILWIIFNLTLGVFMGIYHQGGIVPAQIWIGKHLDSELGNKGGQDTGVIDRSAIAPASETSSVTEIFWWQTYSPPEYLLGHNYINTTSLMGMPWLHVSSRLQKTIKDSCAMKLEITSSTRKDTNPAEMTKSVALVAPWSSRDINILMKVLSEAGLSSHEIWRHNAHFNLDDLDIGTDGLIETIRHLVTKRGLVIWQISRICSDENLDSSALPKHIQDEARLHRDW